VGAKDTIKILLRDTMGNPVTGANVRMEIEHWIDSFTFIDAGNGEYIFSENRMGYDLTHTLEMYTITVSASREGYAPCSVTKEVPFLVPSLFLIEPVEGWSIDPRDYIFVKVYGTLYLAFSAIEDPPRTTNGIASHSWLILDENGQLLENTQLYGKACLTAEVSLITRGANRECLNNFLKETANYWRNLPTYTTIAEATAKIRDLGSKTLGVVASFYVSAPSSISKLASTATYKTVKLILDTSIETAKMSAESFRYAEMTAAFVFLEEAAWKADQAVSVLDGQEGIWNYKLAERFYSNYHKAILTGMESMVLCTEALPDGDVYSQIKSVLTNFASGLLSIDIAVDELINLDEPLKKAIESRGKFESLFGPADAAYTSNAEKVRECFIIYDKIADVSNLLQEATAIEVGNVGASVTVKGSSDDNGEGSVSYSHTYSHGIDVETVPSIGKVTVKVSSEISTGKTIVINIDDQILLLSDLREILVLYDGSEIDLADDYADVLNPNNENVPEYLVLVGSAGMQVLVSIPHFSTHTIEVEKLEIVEVLVKGLPLEISTLIYIDQMFADQMNCSQPKSFEFEYNTSHVVSVEEYLPINAGIRYRCPSNTINVSSSTRLEFEYFKQYYLTIDTAHGRPQGEGWYDDGSTAILIVQNAVPMDGLLGLLGAKKTFSHWSGDFTSSDPTADITMNEPKQVEAIWKDDYSVIYFEFIILVSVVCIIFFYRWKTKKDAEYSGRG